jgi:hypothetical protein
MIVDWLHDDARRLNENHLSACQIPQPLTCIPVTT